MLVYRVENDEGFGPYQYLWEYTYDILVSHDNESHPSPYVDWVDGGWFKYRDDLFCGLISLEHLKKWFEGWLDVLTEHGFQIVTYEATEVYFGDDQGQVLFLKEGVPQTLEKVAA